MREIPLFHDLSWIIEGKLAASSKPRTVEDLKHWWNEGIRAVINLLQDYEKTVPDDEYVKIGFDYLSFPIPDMDAPDVEDLKRLVKWIDERIRAGKPVLVHCFAGLGRTGTVITAYIIYKEKLSVDEAIKYVRSKRPGSVQSFEQYVTLQMFEKYYSKI